MKRHSWLTANENVVLVGLSLDEDRSTLSMIWQRILSAAIGVPVLIAIIWLGDPIFSIAICGAAIWGGLEFYGLAKRIGYTPPTFLGTLLIVATIANAYLRGAYSLHIITLAALTSLVWLLFRRLTENALSNWAVGFAGMIYVGWFLSYFVFLRQLENGIGWIMITLFSTFAVDTVAYFVGSAIGRHKLWPSISPGKTWEGAAGGFIAGVAAAILLSMIFTLPMDLLQAAILGILISIVSQLGDLIESAFKRSAHVKDASTIIPGHGGLLDRVDSLMFPAVVVYYYAVWALG